MSISVLMSTSSKREGDDLQRGQRGSGRLWTYFKVDSNILDPSIPPSLVSDVGVDYRSSDPLC